MTVCSRGKTRPFATSDVPKAISRRWCCARRRTESSTSFRTSAPRAPSVPRRLPFKEGDRAWTGAAIAEIPDLSNMRIELKLEEVDRGKLKLGQKVRVRVDAIADRELPAELDWISPIAAVNFRGMGMTRENVPGARDP